MLIYLRHGDDRGHDVYKHDRPLNDRGKKKARKACEKLTETYGHPDIVFVSPFRRAIQTLDAMTAHFKRPVSIHCDPSIAQYLGKKREPIISPATAELVAIDEGAAAFQARVSRHVEETKRRHRLGAVIWCITHQIVIEEAAQHFDVEILSELDFLDHVVMLQPR